MDFYKAIKNRRTKYAISAKSPISDARLEEIVREMVQFTPSSFHSQSSRVLILLGEKHLKLWDITLNILKEIVPAEAFSATESKIKSFAAGYGTLLYFEDQEVVRGLQEKFPSYKDNFPIWSNQSCGMLQANSWAALNLEGLGVSLQHYNPIIDQAVRAEFDVPENWKLNAQMPFGVATAEPAELTYIDLPARVRVLK